MSRSALRIASAALALASAATLAGCTFHLTVPTTAPTTATQAATDGNQPPAGYIEQKSDGGNIVVWVPQDWTDTHTQKTTDGQGATWIQFDIAPDVDAYNSDVGQPGMTLQASADYAGTDGTVLLSDAVETADRACTQTSSESYNDSYFVGQFYWYKDCADEADTQIALFVGNSSDKSTVVLINAQFEPGVDHTADMQEIMSSFNTAF